ncbi:putative Kinesin heavy chain [Paratrimastix pyriformis]|uniref:Kinesin heavy chain n=1 Tax=Paratrimastix pyriformis TaxID=342808 RepID=A0ABQ8UTL5_9EUKA|nr:putative Kinesin heavy chain [Paratrimastix pyriformis]
MGCTHRAGPTIKIRHLLRTPHKQHAGRMVCSSPGVSPTALSLTSAPLISQQLTQAGINRHITMPPLLDESPLRTPARIHLRALSPTLAPESPSPSPASGTAGGSPLATPFRPPFLASPLEEPPTPAPHPLPRGLTVSSPAGLGREGALSEEERRRVKSLALADLPTGSPSELLAHASQLRRGLLYMVDEAQAATEGLARSKAKFATYKASMKLWRSQQRKAVWAAMTRLKHRYREALAKHEESLPRARPRPRPGDEEAASADGPEAAWGAQCAQLNAQLEAMRASQQQMYRRIAGITSTAVAACAPGDGAAAPPPPPLLPAPATTSRAEGPEAPPPPPVSEDLVRAELGWLEDLCATRLPAMAHRTQGLERQCAALVDQRSKASEELAQLNGELMQAHAQLQELAQYKVLMHQDAHLTGLEFARGREGLLAARTLDCEAALAAATATQHAQNEAMLETRRACEEALQEAQRDIQQARAEASQLTAAQAEGQQWQGRYQELQRVAQQHMVPISPPATTAPARAEQLEAELARIRQQYGQQYADFARALEEHMSSHARIQRHHFHFKHLPDLPPRLRRRAGARNQREHGERLGQQEQAADHFDRTQRAMQEDVRLVRQSLTESIVLATQAERRRPAGPAARGAMAAQQARHEAEMARLALDQLRIQYADAQQQLADRRRAEERARGELQKLREDQGPVFDQLSQAAVQTAALQRQLLQREDEVAALEREKAELFASLHAQIRAAQQAQQQLDRIRSAPGLQASPQASPVPSQLATATGAFAIARAAAASGGPTASPLRFLGAALADQKRRAAAAAAQPRPPEQPPRGPALPSGGPQQQQEEEWLGMLREELAVRTRQVLEERHTSRGYQGRCEKMVQEVLQIKDQVASLSAKSRREKHELQGRVGLLQRQLEALVQQQPNPAAALAALAALEPPAALEGGLPLATRAVLTAATRKPPPPPPPPPTRPAPAFPPQGAVQLTRLRRELGALSAALGAIRLAVVGMPALSSRSAEASLGQALARLHADRALWTGRLAAMGRELVQSREQLGTEMRLRRALHNELQDARGNIRVYLRIRPMATSTSPPQPQGTAATAAKSGRRVSLGATGRLSGAGRPPPGSPSAWGADGVALPPEGSILGRVAAVRLGTLEVAGDGEHVRVAEGTRALGLLGFDRIWAEGSTQEDIFTEMRPLLTSLLDGYNVCIMAYGQTGSGKTYTMQGAPQTPGIIPHVIEDLFRRMGAPVPAQADPGGVGALLRDGATGCEYRVGMSIFEVYNNAVRDLLVPRDTGAGGGTPGEDDDDGASAEYDRAAEESSPATPVSAGGLGAGPVPGVEAVPVGSPQLALDLIRRGFGRRADASTQMNQSSSRSHGIVMLTVECSNPVAATVTRSKLYLVDLAGSECVAKSKVEGANLREASCINKSLCALGDVLSALGTSQPHIPYRRSKLTHILSDALGGDAKMVMVVCVSPLTSNLTETIHALQFGSRASHVTRGSAQRHTVHKPQKH